jgi:hypothetical protein
LSVLVLYCLCFFGIYGFKMTLTLKITLISSVAKC